MPPAWLLWTVVFASLAWVGYREDWPPFGGNLSGALLVVVPIVGSVWWLERQRRRSGR